MVLLILLLLLSCSWAFGHAVEHGLPLLYPVLYTGIIVLGMAAPAIHKFFAIRRW